MCKNYECVECNEEVTLEYDGSIKADFMQDHEICEDCLEDQYFYCEECDEYHDIDEDTPAFKDDKIIHVCNSCLNDYYFYCDDCDNYYYDSNYYDPTTIYDVDYSSYKIVCDDCKGNGSTIIYCDYHERWEDSQHNYEVENYGMICIKAYEYGDFITCYHCDNVVTIDDATYSDGHDCYYCNDCYEEECGSKGKIKGYHEHKYDYKDNKFINAESIENVITYGFELEVEAGSIDPGSMSEELHDILDNLAVYEEDGSLNNGFEIIFNPFDMTYLKEEGSDKIKAMCEALKNNKYKSHDTSTCGLHVHVGKDGLGYDHYSIENTIMRINVIVEYFKEELTLFSRRKADKLERWARFSTENPKEELTIKEIRERIVMKNGRYSALNVQGKDTIEFRIFRGTIKDSTILATLELVNNIVEYAKDTILLTDEDLNNLDFYKVATYKENSYVEQYLLDRKIIEKVCI